MGAYDHYAAELRKGSTDLLLAVHGVSPAQAKFSKQQAWSIAEIIEHLNLFEQAVLRILSKPTPQDRVKDNSEKIGRDKIASVFGDDSKQYTSPDALLPKQKSGNLTQLQKQFLDTRKQMADLLQQGKVSFDNQLFKHPSLGEMTKKDWLHMLLHHADRHLRQIAVIRQDPEFPKA
jgi:hypothetical protein